MNKIKCEQCSSTQKPIVQVIPIDNGFDDEGNQLVTELTFCVTCVQDTNSEDW